MVDDHIMANNELKETDPKKNKIPLLRKKEWNLIMLMLTEWQPGIKKLQTNILDPAIPKRETVK